MTNLRGKVTAVFTSVMVAFTLLGQLGSNVTAVAVSIYNPGDIAVINRIIDNNGLNWPKAPADGSSIPAEWMVDPSSLDWSDDSQPAAAMTWSETIANRRITSAYFCNVGIFGRVDVSGLSELLILFDFQLNFTNIFTNPFRYGII